MTRLYANNFSTTLSASLNSSDTSCSITSATGLPTITGSDYYYLTCDSEIIKVTARSGTTLTIVRAQEGTTAASHSSGATIDMRETAESFTDKLDKVDGVGTGVIDFGGATSFEVPNSSAPSLTVTGQLALDTTVTDYADGVMYYRSGSVTYGLVAMPVSAMTTPSNGYLISYDSTLDQFKLVAPGSGTGDVVGPSSATDGSVVIYDGTTGKLVKSGTDVTVQGVRVGRGANAVSTNTLVGANSALASASLSGTNVTAVGYGAGAANTSGASNTYVGSGAGGTTTTAGNRVCVGYNAGNSGTSANGNSVAIGAEAGSGGGNTSNFVYVGASAGRYNGNVGSVAIGSDCLSDTNAATSYSVCVGYQSGRRVTGTTNVYVGAYSGGGTATSASGASNTGVGQSALAAVTSGTLDVAIGSSALSALTTGSNNTALGNGAGVSGATGATSHTTGSNNTYIGYRAAGTAADNAGTIAIGADAVALKHTGTGSGDYGPGIAIGSAAFPVGFRGDGTIFPSSSGGAGFARLKLNGTQYFLPLFADGATAIGTGGGGGMTMNTASGTTQSAAVNNGYICTNASQCNVTLPATAAVGDLVKVVSQGAGGIKVTANTGQTIKGLGDTTTSAGSVTCAAQYDSIQVICVVANTTWVVDTFTSSLLTFA